MLTRRLAIAVLAVWIACRLVCAADANPAFQNAKQTFFREMKKKSAADRSEAVTAFAEIAQKETAELILKRLFSDPDPQVRLAAQKGLAKLSEDDEVRQFLVDEFKKLQRKQGAEDTFAQLLRALAATEDEALQTDLIKSLDEYLRSPKGNILLPMTLIDDLGQQGDVKAVQAIKLLSRARPFEAKFGYRRCVVQAVSNFRQPEAIDFLIALLPQSQGQLQYDIVQQLTKATKQKFRDEDKAWRAWWQDNRATFQFPKPGDPVVAFEDNVLQYYGIPICAKRVVFVLDTSGSMRGEPMEAAKRALTQTLEKLPDVVQFDVVMFDRTVSAWQKELVSATRDAKSAATRAVLDRGMDRGTASNAALNAAFQLDPEAIYFLSDGEPTDGRPDQIISAITTLNRTRRVSIHTIGVVTDRTGGAGLALFMKPLADQNYGSFQLVK